MNPSTYDIERYLEEIMNVDSLGKNIFIVLVAIAAYVLQAIALYTIAQRRGYQKPWLGWIPFANCFLLGKMSDDINRYRNKKTNNGVILLSLNIAKTIVTVAVFGCAVWILTRLMVLMYGLEETDKIANFVAILIGLLVFLVIIAIAYAVFRFIALYRIFTDYDQSNATLFIVLSILFGRLALSELFLFIVRNKPSASLYYAQQYQEYLQQQAYFNQPQYEQPQPQYPNNME